MDSVGSKRQFGTSFAPGTLGFFSREFSSSEEVCEHSTLLDGKCIACKKDIGDGYGVAFDYILSGLRYSDEQIARMKKNSSKKLFTNRKLILVLDLDHTLLHTRAFSKLTSADKLLKEQAHSLKNISKSRNSDLFNIDDQFLTKLRPYVRSFLEEASTMFEMYIYTMGNRYYASRVAKILDPEFKYFQSRIISREDFKQREGKNLNLVLGQESDIVILDDTESVWNENKDNLITVGCYNYFKNTRMGHKSYSEKKTDESETDGALANVLKVLKTIHGLFFDACKCRDVRILMAKIRSGILMGCTLLISDDDDGEDYNLVWYRAEEMGASCTTVIDSSITHVVSSKRATNNCQWGEREKKNVVHPRWIHAAYFLWRRQSEELYLPLSR